MTAETLGPGEQWSTPTCKAFVTQWLKDRGLTNKLTAKHWVSAFSGSGHCTVTIHDWAPPAHGTYAAELEALAKAQRFRIDYSAAPGYTIVSVGNSAEPTTYHFLKGAQ